VPPERSHNPAPVKTIIRYFEKNKTLGECFVPVYPVPRQHVSPSPGTAPSFCHSSANRGVAPSSITLGVAPSCAPDTTPTFRPSSANQGAAPSFTTPSVTPVLSRTYRGLAPQSSAPSAVPSTFSTLSAAPSAVPSVESSLNAIEASHAHPAAASSSPITAPVRPSGAARGAATSSTAPSAAPSNMSAPTRHPVEARRAASAGARASSSPAAPSVAPSAVPSVEPLLIPIEPLPLATAVAKPLRRASSDLNDVTLVGAAPPVATISPQVCSPPTLAPISTTPTWSRAHKPREKPSLCPSALCFCPSFHNVSPTRPKPDKISNQPEWKPFQAESKKEEL
jgi:hypothetical protein